MDNTKNTVYVLGAGFSRAFCHNAPLLNWNMDEYIETLKDKFRKFPVVRQILNMMQMEKGHIVNIESMLSRLHSQAPYDEVFFSTPERMALYDDIYNYFTQVIGSINVDDNKKTLLDKFSQYVIEKQIDCITFNYDSMLDKSLWEYKGTTSILDEKYWHPDGGYGFFCRPASSLISDHRKTVKDITSMSLLKLHGSLNWRIKKGFQKPYPLDSLVHDELLMSIPSLTSEDVSAHLELEPFVIPPVLDKSALAGEPILKVVWGNAYNKLLKAEQVVFIGYSLPKTDIAASFLFREALLKLNRTHITVVTVGKTEAEKKSKIESYREIFHGIKNSQFEFSGAEEWIKDNCIWSKPEK